MKRFLSILCLLGYAVVHAFGAAPAPAASPSTNTLIIVSEQPGMFTPTNALWSKQVRAGDGEIYLECELLTAFFSTNSVRTNVIARTNAAARINAAARTRPAQESGADSRFERVLAETNVMIIFNDIQVLGDRAEYLATNDLLTVTGNPVIVENERGYMVCPWVTYNRTTKATVFGAPNTSFLIDKLMSRTNAPAGGQKPDAVPLQK